MVMERNYSREDRRSEEEEESARRRHPIRARLGKEPLGHGQGLCGP
jgi:hypothetical protein